MPISFENRNIVYVGPHERTIIRMLDDKDFTETYPYIPVISLNTSEAWRGKSVSEYRKEIEKMCTDNAYLVNYVNSALMAQRPDLYKMYFGKDMEK